MDTRVLNKTLSDLERLASNYLEEFNRRFAAGWNRDYSVQSIKTAGDDSSAATQSERKQLRDAIDLFCDSYLAATDQNRTILRAALSNLPSLLQVLRPYIGWCQERINTPTDRLQLRRGLSAASLEDNRVSYKEMYMALGSLYIRCVKVGLQPSTEFVKMAFLSSTEKSKAGISTREFLMNFEESAFFKADIEPKL